MAYASVASLVRTMESVLHFKSPMQSLICDQREEFLAIHQKVGSLEEFLKNFEKDNDSGKMMDLEEQIKEVANVVEHVIRLRLTETLMANDEMEIKMAHEKFCDSLQQVAEEIDRVHKESTSKFQDKGKQASNKPLVPYPSSEKGIPNVNKTNMVGRDGERKRLIKDLTRCFSGESKVIPIVGMGGIGKTTLAKEVFDDASIRSHFDVCGWATLSQHHNVKGILQSLLHSSKGETFHKEDESKLADMLRKSLIGKRYLIVMDDMWSSKAWDDVRQCFPSQNNASRILLTTRNTEVAQYAGTDNLSLQIDFMDSDDSWNIFKSVAFTNDTLPSELESIGKKIVDKCQGLPLSIVVVAGLLSKSKRTTEVWETAAENIMSFVAKDPDEQCLHVLGLSYNHLSGDLKACLLYFGIFPEDSEISVERLVTLWIGEGFLKLGKDLEGQAEKCLQDLIDRCLVLVGEKKHYENRIKSCKVHDLIYEMCLREAQRKNLFIMNEIVLDYDDGLDEDHDIVCDSEHNLVPPDCRHLKMQPLNKWIHDDFNYSCHRALVTPGHHHLIKEQTDDNILKHARSIFSFYRYPHPGVFTLDSDLIHFNLLRILDLSPIKLTSFPPQILCLVWLRYVAMYSCWKGIPQEICGLWNLQTLIVTHGGRDASIFTESIWELMHLRHLRLNCFYLPNPPSVLGFPEVHTLLGLSPSSCTKEVFSGIRNIKKLGICGEDDDYATFRENKLFDNLVHLHQLETLSLNLLTGFLSKKISLPSAKAFPATLRKLKLERTCLRWDELDIIGNLPNLEVLKLLWNACNGEEWHPAAGGFTRLKVLLIRSCPLKYWKATNDNFPVLERLFIETCTKLDEIPIEFSEIQSLQLIDLERCKPNLKASAAQIQQEQQDLGNKPVHVRVDGKVIILDDDEGDNDDDDDDDDGDGNDN